MRDLHEFLVQAELSDYYSPLLTILKVSTVAHLKYVQEVDLKDIGMTRPEMRRLKKFYKKECPQGAINKLKKTYLEIDKSQAMFERIKSAILKGGGDGPGRTISPPPPSPSQRGSQRLLSSGPYGRPSGRQLIAMESIHLGRTLGQGEFGLVQQGIWKTESGDLLQVAVKRLSKERVNTGTQNFLKEAAIMQEVDHEHIVRMFGVVLDTDENMMLVTELASLRSLLECLKDPALRCDLPVTRLCDYAVQVCEGMSYLESKRMVHRDLAARNILVFNWNQVKISDLGLSRFLEVGQDYYQSKFSSSLRLPIAWCAPECINFLKFTSASDVWSFGVTLWEFFTYGFQPWAGLTGQQILQAIDEPNSHRLDQPELCTNEMYKLMIECWAHDPETRPKFCDILLRFPQLKPTQVKALTSYPSQLVEKGYIYYKAGDVIVVIDKSPVTSSLPGLVWKGVLVNGKCGLFDPTNAVPFIEPKIGTVTSPATSIVRKESSRKSGRKIRADMISHPQNDLRHTGHIGYDGAVFGDVSFIADNYDKLPVKVDAGSCTDHGCSSSPGVCDSPVQNGHFRSSDSHDWRHADRNGYGQSWTSRESLDSQSTCQLELDGRVSPCYLDIEDDSLFSDFKMPDLGSSFDFGSSLMDEVLKALDDKEKLINSSTDATFATGHSHFDSNIRASSGRTEPPVPAPRETRTSLSSVPPLPTQPPRVEHPKEKKQAKVKPMSASEERRVDTAMARARELTSHMIGGSAQSPPVSPSQDAKSSFFGEDSGIISRLKNSIKLSSSPKNEHKRTFSDDLEHKGDEVTPEAQQAYNMLVVKGSFKDKSSGSQNHSVALDFGHKDTTPDSKRARSQTSKTEPSDGLQPDLLRDSKSSPNSTKISGAQASLSSQFSPVTAGAASSPQISTPALPQNKPVGLHKPTPNPVPAPRPVPAENTRMSEILIIQPRPEVHIVDTTVWLKTPTSPNIPPKRGKRLESHIPVPAFEDFEEATKIEIVCVNDSGIVHDDVSFEHSVSQSLQRSFMDRSDNSSEAAEPEQAEWGLTEYSAHESKRNQGVDSRTISSIDCHDSFNRKQTSSIFDEDLSAPSPQEIMSRLRERRLNQHLDRQRAQAAENEASSAVATTRSRPSAREPQSNPGRAPSVDAAEGGGDGGNEEVDTNPLRMLRGGAIPIRTAGRGSAGTGNHGNRGAVALRVPRLNFSRDLSRRSVTDHQKTELPLESGAADHLRESIDHQKIDLRPIDDSGHQKAALPQRDGTDHQKSALPLRNREPVPADIVKTAEEDEIWPNDCAAAELPREVETFTDPSTEVNHSLVPSVVAVEESKKLLSQDLRSDLSMSLTPASASSQPFPCVDSCSSSKEATTDADGGSVTCKIPVKSDGEILAPPRLPPRRSQSLNENSEKSEAHLSVPYSLRRSNSVEENNDVEAPALPPRQPHPGRTPLNIRPRERRFPLQIHLPSQDKSPRQPPTSPRNITATTPTSKQISHLRSPSHAVPSPPTLLSPTHSRKHPLTSITPPRHQTGSQHHLPTSHLSNSPTCNHSHRHPPLHNCMTSHSLDSATPSHHHHHRHHPSCLDLPPEYDLSGKYPISSSDMADSEPTHMLLDPHTPHLPLPLSVSLPPSSDMASMDEPTHVSLSSLTDSKHSWSATFTSPSPLSPSFVHKQHTPTQSMTRTFDRILGNDHRGRAPNLYPDISDSQSPPADLPPAPPTPSYREKLGLEQPKPQVVRSISHTPNTHKSGPHFLTVDSISYRGRSASTNSPITRNHSSDSYITSPSQTSSSRAFNFPHLSYDDDDDDAFFAEAPSYPHPYSQSPFHPLVLPSPKDIPHSSSLYSIISPLQLTPDISPYQVSSPISLSNHPSHSPSPLPAFRLDSNPPPFFQRNVESHVTPSHTQSADKYICPPRPLSPRTAAAHSYNTVLLPPSHPAPSSPSISRATLKSFPTRSTNQISHKLGTYAASPSQSHQQFASSKLDSPQQSTALHVFKFPSVVRTEGSFTIPLATSPSSAAALQLGTHHIKADLSPIVDCPSSCEVSPLMFASYTAASSVSYEDLRQFAMDRQKNCEEIETLLKIFHDQVTVDECMTALESTQWDVTKATKYLQLKKLLSLGVADVHKCKEALCVSGWDLQCAAETLLESSRMAGISSSSPSSLSSSYRGPPARPGIITPHNRPATPEILDV